MPELGLAGGLCWAALDRYLRGTTIPRDLDAPEPGSALHSELRQRQVAALAGLWPRIRAWQDRPDGSWRDRLPVPLPFQGRDLASGTRAEWRGLRRRLDTGQPVLLTLLPGGGGYDRPRAVRQVLATGWSRSGTRVTLTLYDPDCPGDDDIRLAFDLAGELDARLTGGAEVRGFFAVPYDRALRPTLRAEAFDDRSVIGLRREIRGRPSPAVGRRNIALLARNPQGGLLHFERRDGQHWEGTNVTEAEDFGAHELHSDPVGFQRAGTLHVFARSYTGDLLHFRRFRSWSLTNRTDHKRAGARFRIQGRPVPVPGPRLRISVLGRDGDGGLVHYHAAPFRGWHAEQVPGDPVADDPVAARTEDTLHVVGLASDGRVLHWSRREVWAMTDTDAGPGPRVRLAGRPVLHLTPERVSVFGRGEDGQLAILELGDDGVWQRTMLATDLAADPAITAGPGGLHAFAPTTDGRLVHAWRRDGTWTHEDVIGSRPTLEPGPTGEADITAWGDDRALRVFVRRGSGLRALTWNPDGDWVADTVTDRAADAPTAFRDHRGRPHVAVTDGRGIIVHVETGEWREPGRASERAPVATVPTVERKGAEPRPRTPAPESEDAALPLLDEPDEAARDDGDPAADRRDEVAEAPAAEAEAPPSGPQVLDFELERLHAEPATPTSSPPTAEGAEEAAPEPEPVDEPEDLGAGGTAAPEREEETAARREFRWEDRPPPTSPDQVEPMDLSALDSWPPTRREREPTRENGTDREAS